MKYVYATGVAILVTVFLAVSWWLWRSPSDSVTTISSEDGMALLWVPAEALSRSEMNSITLQRILPPDDAGSDADRYIAYELRPSGLTLDVPATFQATLPMQDVGKIPIAFHIADGEQAAVEPLSESNVAIDMETHTASLSGDVGHFSRIIIDQQGPIDFTYAAPQSRIAVGQPAAMEGRIQHTPYLLQKDAWVWRQTAYAKADKTISGIVLKAHLRESGKDIEHHILRPRYMAYNIIKLVKMRSSQSVPFVGKYFTCGESGHTSLLAIFDWQGDLLVDGVLESESPRGSVTVRSPMFECYVPEGKALCGNGKAEGAEECDGMDVRGETCATLGFDDGTLACTSGCRFDVEQCAQPSGAEQTEEDGPVKISLQFPRLRIPLGERVEMTGVVTHIPFTLKRPNPWNVDGTLEMLRIRSLNVRELPFREENRILAPTYTNSIWGRQDIPPSGSKSFKGTHFICDAADKTVMSVRIDWDGYVNDGNGRSEYINGWQMYYSPVIECTDPRKTCGNRKRDGGEECDGNDFGGKTCGDYGFNQGQLLCTADCAMNFEDCRVAAPGKPATCTYDPVGDLVTEDGQRCHYWYDDQGFVCGECFTADGTLYDRSCEDEKCCKWDGDNNALCEFCENRSGNVTYNGCEEDSGDVYQLVPEMRFDPAASP